jgi:hypothetical protein
MADEKRKQQGVVKQTLESYLLTPTAALNQPGACGINRARPASTLIHLPASWLKVDKFSPLPEFGHRIQQAVMPIVTKAEDEFIPLRTGFVVAAGGLMMRSESRRKGIGTPARHFIFPTSD